jgi:hypothetical protein
MGCDGKLPDSGLPRVRAPIAGVLGVLGLRVSDDFRSKLV